MIASVRGKSSKRALGFERPKTLAHEPAPLLGGGPRRDERVGGEILAMQHRARRERMVRRHDEDDLVGEEGALLDRPGTWLREHRRRDERDVEVAAFERLERLCRVLDAEIDLEARQGLPQAHERRRQPVVRGVTLRDDSQARDLARGRPRALFEARELDQQSGCSGSRRSVSAVATRPRAVRSKSRTPSLFSAPSKARLTAGWVRCSASAARAVVPARARTRITWRSRTSRAGARGASMRFMHRAYEINALDASAEERDD